MKIPTKEKIRKEMLISSLLANSHDSIFFRINDINNNFRI